MKFPSLPVMRQAGGLLLRQKPIQTVSGRSSGFWEQNKFQNLLQDWQATGKHGRDGEKFWRNVSLFVCIPLCVGYGVFAFTTEFEHWKHPRPEFVPYEHLRLRYNEFPWGDGNHTLFHNAPINPLPEGYEVADPNAGNAHH